MSAPPAVPWPAYLGALEEWLRRTEQGLLDGAEAPPEELALVADGPLPADLALRARVLLAGVQRIEQLGQERRAALLRAQAYARH